MLHDILGSGTFLDVVYTVIGVAGLLAIPRLLDALHIGPGRIRAASSGSRIQHEPGARRPARASRASQTSRPALRIWKARMMSVTPFSRDQIPAKASSV